MAYFGWGMEYMQFGDFLNLWIELAVNKISNSKTFIKNSYVLFYEVIKVQ